MSFNPSKVHIETLTLSDTRTAKDDDGGNDLARWLSEGHYTVRAHQIVREDVELIRAAVKGLLARPEVDAVITTGGTGLSPRDNTFAALMPLFDKPIIGFGETFRRLSYDQIGARAVLSNAVAGVASGKVIIALPGSRNAIRLAVTQLIAPMLWHAVEVANGRAVHHEPNH